MLGGTLELEFEPWIRDLLERREESERRVIIRKITVKESLAFAFTQRSDKSIHPLSFERCCR